MTRLVILGCGNSAGIPAFGNYWGACDPAEPRNRRTRAAAALKSDTTTLLIDAGPDIREQVNRAGIERIDGVLFTHAHADHIHGIDDLRSYRLRSKALVNVWANQPTMDELKDRFAYMFTDRHEGIYPRVLEPHIYEHGTPLTIGDITVIPFEQDHDTCITTGFRIGNTAYSTDVIRLGEDALRVLTGVKTWVVDAAGYKMPENQVHMRLKDVYQINERVQAERVYITHLTPGMDYQTMRKELPEGFEPAWDGLEIKIDIR